MKPKTMEKLVDRAFEFVDEGVINFCFQGGEPLLVGIDYYRRFISYVNSKNISNVRINYSLQTNGTLITDEFAELFTENSFLIGVSLDGISQVHNALRNASFDSVMHGINILKKHNTNFNILAVLTKQSVNHIKEIYEFMLENKFYNLQFIPCLSSLKDDFSRLVLNDDEWFIVHKELFDLYLASKRRKESVSIRYFDNLINIIQGYRNEMCSMNGYCSIQLVVDANGDVYPCDFYCTDEYKLGSIMMDTIDHLAKKDITKRFIIESLPNQSCKLCDVYHICRGGCRRERNTNKIDIYCKAKRNLILYIINKISNI